MGHMFIMGIGPDFLLAKKNPQKDTLQRKKKNYLVAHGG